MAGPLDAHRDSTAMARCLVGYIDDDEAVWRAVHSEFDTSIGVQSIARIRRERQAADQLYRRGKIGKHDHERSWDWTGEQHQRDMEMASAVFAKAIQRERGRL